MCARITPQSLYVCYRFAVGRMQGNNVVSWDFQFQRCLIIVSRFNFYSFQLQDVDAQYDFLSLPPCICLLVFLTVSIPPNQEVSALARAQLSRCLRHSSPWLMPTVVTDEGDWRSRWVEWRSFLGSCPCLGMASSPGSMAGPQSGAKGNQC